jgi:hypothetical protein
MRSTASAGEMRLEKSLARVEFLDPVKFLAVV